MKKIGRRALNSEDVSDLDIAETLENVKPHPDMDYRELLAFAIKKENISQDLYTRLAVIFPEPELQDIPIQNEKSVLNSNDLEFLSQQRA